MSKKMNNGTVSRSCRNREIARRIGHAALLVGALAFAQGAGAGIITTGAFFTEPGGVPIGPGNTLQPATILYVGASAPGTLDADDGSRLQLSSLVLGTSGNGTGEGHATLTGTGTTVELVSPGSIGHPLNRLEVGSWGRGMLLVQGGARVNGRADAAACAGVEHYCNAFVGNGAGSDGTLTVTGSGSSVELLGYFGVGNAAVFRPPFVNFTFGTPGGTTRAQVNVLAGGSLTTDNGGLALGPSGEIPLGTERTFASVTIDGAGSTWRVTGGTSQTHDPYVVMGHHRNSTADMTLSNGGALIFGNPVYHASFFGVAHDGSRADVNVNGAGSRIAFEGETGIMHIGERGGFATVRLSDGAGIEHPWSLVVGNAGGFGNLDLDGPTTRVLVDSGASPLAVGGAFAPQVRIGNGGVGFATLSNGAQLDIRTNVRHVNGPFLFVGWEPASFGSLSIAKGSVVSLSAESVAPGTAGEAFNPFVGIGRSGAGSVEISSGGKLLIDGRAVSTPTDRRSTGVQVGIGTGTQVAGHGRLSIVGAGSELRVRGTEGNVQIGIGAGGSGELHVRDGGLIEALNLNVGTEGGSGLARIDNARIELHGEWSSLPYGAGIAIGLGDGSVGNMSLTNGSLVRIENTSGIKGGGIAIGGVIGGATGGDGTLTLSASRIEMAFHDALGGLTVAYTGTGLLRLKDASSIDMGAASLLVAQTHGSDGTVIATGNSSITAGWVGIGRNRDTLGNTFDGGTATMLLRDSTLTATDIVIGTNGFLTGCNAVINGNVTNFGGFSPGCSPGRFTINGNYIAEVGSRLILEVEDDGAGGFRTDDLRFGADGIVDLDGLNIEFRFLGNTNPLLFRQSGLFDVNTFLHRIDMDGMLHLLDPSAFDGVGFGARSDAFDISAFSYNVRDGARFFTNAPAVPAPAGAVLTLLGLCCAAIFGRARSFVSAAN